MDPSVFKINFIINYQGEQLFFFELDALSSYILQLMFLEF